jgi:hypothetical protein
MKKKLKANKAFGKQSAKNGKVLPPSTAKNKKVKPVKGAFKQSKFDAQKSKVFGTY